MQSHKRHACYLILLALIQLNGIFASEAKRKILFVDSYNANLWSATIEKGIHSVLDKHNDIELKVFRMDTKQNNSEKFKKQAAIKAKEIIEKWNPDVVIASDDNAAKYLIVPYFMNSDIPFVFCGINFDSSRYGFPTKNITGMEEVILLDETLNIIKEYTKGNKLGIIAADNISAHKTYEYLTKVEKKNFTTALFVKTFEELKKAFIEIQSKVDILYLYDTATVKNFDFEEMIAFANKNTVIPTFGSHYLTIKYTLLGTPKIGEELGKWAANTSLRILNGTKPEEIPITKNKQTKIYLNLSMAKKLGIKFPIDLIDNSYLIYDKEKKILLINLYEHQCLQNQNIEEGIISSLNLNRITETEFDNTESKFEFKYYKRNIPEIPNQNTINIIKQQIQKIVKFYEPNVIIAINNDTFKKILEQFNTGSTIPLVLCNPDFSISIIDNNKSNEISLHNKPVVNIINFAKTFTDGNKIGYIGFDSASSRKLVNIMQTKLNIKLSKGYFVSSFDELKNKFMQLQNEVNIICFFNICQLTDPINNQEFISFFTTNTKIPTINFNSNNNKFSLLEVNQARFEQGLIAVNVAAQIISNNNVNNINIENLNNQNISINKLILNNLNFSQSKENGIY